ncbi:MAG TPA: translesion DNA synthesis-associated protein ImuA [Burkholderiaceae bacterium]|nr:translesion DNA synthesis-associated protein ImuA [Burkholderiaceae bacterium]
MAWSDGMAVGRALQKRFATLWYAHQLSTSSYGTTASGFPDLDAELPGEGWPHRVLTELLLPHSGLGELRLLMPALARIAGGGSASVHEGGRSVMLFDPPAALCGSALAQLGVDARQLLVVHGREGARASAGLRRLLPSADLLWALEQALKSGHVGAVLAWLPQRLRADALRRLQLAAQSHDGPAFVFREVDARLKPSAAPLRLLLQGAGVDRLSVRVLKRRGPPLTQSLALDLAPILSDRLRARVRGSKVDAASRQPAEAPS